MSQGTNELYEFGDFRLNVNERVLERKDGAENGHLTDKAFRTLCCLVRNHGRLLTKKEILDQVWPDAFVEENNLDKCIYSIRQFLGENRSAQKYIQTVHKYGYRFVAEVESLIYDGSTSQNSVGSRENSRAYDLYVRGKVKVASENREDTEAAIQLFQESVAIDPNFAEAFAQLARGYNTLAFKYSSDLESKRLQENGEVAIEKAIALNPDLAEAHLARGLILWTNTKRFPHEQAIQSYKRSLVLDPKSDEAHHQLSIVFGHIGLMDEAHRSLNNALQINPNNTMARYRVGVYKTWQGKFDEAVAVFKTIPSEVSPMLIDRSTAEALAQSGHLAEAEKLVDECLKKYPQDEGGSFTSVKALLLAKAGKLNEAEAAIQRAVQIGNGYGHFHHTAYNVASAYSAMNDPVQAVTWLEAVAEDGFPNYSYFEIDSNLNNIRKHPLFIELMRKLKPQWERFKALA